MPKKKSRDPTEILFALLVILLLLKGFGVLKAYFNIDPDGVTFSIDLGFVASATLFGLLWHRLNQLNDRLTQQGERLAKLEAKAEK